MDDVLAFRNKMAESGYELTPDSAEQVLAQVDEIIDMAQSHPDDIRALAELTETERQALVKDFAECGVEITFGQLDDLIEMLVDIVEDGES